MSCASCLRPFETLLLSLCFRHSASVVHAWLLQRAHRLGVPRSTGVRFAPSFTRSSWRTASTCLVGSANCRRQTEHLDPRRQVLCVKCRANKHERMGNRGLRRRVRTGADSLVIDVDVDVDVDVSRCLARLRVGGDRGPTSPLTCSISSRTAANVWRSQSRRVGALQAGSCRCEECPNGRCLAAASEGPPATIRSVFQGPLLTSPTRRRAIDDDDGCVGV